MNFVLQTIIVALLSTNFAVGQEKNVLERIDSSLIFDRSAPWWSGLRDEVFYKQCHSSCTKGSKGTRVKVELCDDYEVCRGQKGGIDDFATEKCSEWKSSGSVPEVPIQNEGRRFKHEPSKGSWISCAIFCRTDKKQWYSPRLELGKDAFFPDGTWCHTDSDNVNYYCQKNLCLPEGYKFSHAVRLAEEILVSGKNDSFIIEEDD